jgi:hypothetical protein
LRAGRAETKQAGDGLDELVLLGAEVLLHDPTDCYFDFFRRQILWLAQRVGVDLPSIPHDHFLTRQRVEGSTDNIALPLRGLYGG